MLIIYLNKNDDYVVKNEIKIDIPDDLKQILNEDYENMCINNKVNKHKISIKLYKICNKINYFAS
jgi:hypothetical protein